MTIKDDLAEIPSDGINLEDIEKEEEKETPPEATTEEKPEEKKDEEEVPFHKHPRFKALVEERNQYKQDLEDMREEMDSKFSEIKESQSKTTRIPAWFTELYGENETAWDKYQAYDKQTRDEIKQEIRDEFQSEQKEKAEAGQKWNNWIDDQVSSLEEEGKKFDKNELMKVMMDYKPSDDKGNLDFKRGYEILEILKKKDPEKAKARKEIINDGKNSKVDLEAKKWHTPDDNLRWPA